MMLHLFDASGATVAIDAGVVHLEEARSYHLAAPHDGITPRAWLGERELRWNAIGAGFAVDIGHWVGSSTLRVLRGQHETVVAVEVAPRREKLSDDTWLSLLADLEAWLPGLAVGLEGGGVGAVATEGASATVLAAALLPIVPALLHAVECIARAPREHTTPLREAVPLRTVRRADRETLHWLARHPEVSRAVDPWFVARAGLRDPHLPQDRTQETLDHPVNCYLAWLVKRVARNLGELGEALAVAAKRLGLQADAAAWCTARSATAARASGALTEALRSTFLGTLVPAPATEAALLALGDDPAYARVHALARPFLSPRFQLRDELDGGVAPVRPSFELYELWTLLAVHRALASLLVGWTWSWKAGPGDTLLAGFGPGATFTATGPAAERVQVHYNMTFPGFLTRGSSERYSLSGERRPDISVSYEQAGVPRSWVVLDAKYRVRRDALADAFTSLHIYRDALRWDPFGGQCRGGLLLVPATEPECEPWFARDFHERFGIGAWRLTPGQPADRELARVVLGMLAPTLVVAAPAG